MKLLARHDTRIATIGTAVLAAGYYWGIVSPGHVTARQIAAEIAQAQASLAEIPALMAQRAELLSRLNQKRQQLEMLEKVLPIDSNVTDVLHDITSHARRSGLTVTRLEPLATVPFASYSSHPFRLSCRGTFADVSEFLNGLETQLRLITFDNVDFIRGPGAEGNVAHQLIQVNLNFNAYSRHAESTRVAENTSSRPSRPSDN